jgi:hypothetical protein
MPSFEPCPRIALTDRFINFAIFTAGSFCFEWRRNSAINDLVQGCRATRFFTFFATKHLHVIRYQCARRV